MTTILQAIILGILQGVTEWLPVSSSGHLVIAQHLFGVTEPIALDLMLHIGTVLVVIFIFRKEIMKILKALFTWKTKDPDFKLFCYIILASIPTAIIGFAFKDFIEASFSSLIVVGTALIFTGFILFFSHKKTNKKLSTWKSFVVGIAQGIAIIPGVSRSGSTIGSGILLGVERKTAALFSFLIFIPAMLGASILQIDKIVLIDLPIIIGTIAAMIVSFFMIKWLLLLIQKQKFWLFSFYCWAVGLVVLICVFFQ